MSDVMIRQLLAAIATISVSMTASAMAAMVDGEELIDPTAPFLLDMETAGGQPVANTFARTSTYEVSSILIRDNLRIAVINSRRVREGEFVGNARVVRIEEGEVTIDLGGETRVLGLHGGTSIKTRTDEQN